MISSIQWFFWTRIGHLQDEYLSFDSGINRIGFEACQRLVVMRSEAAFMGFKNNHIVLHQMKVNIPMRETPFTGGHLFTERWT